MHHHIYYSSSEKQNRIYRDKKIYHKELAHTITEPDKFQDLQLVTWRPRKANGVISESEALRTRRANGISSSPKHGSSVQSLRPVQLFVTPWTTACQASLSITNSQSLLKLMSIESVMASNHLILCSLLLWPSILPSIRVFSNESVLHIRWPNYWSFSFNTSPSNEYSSNFTCFLLLFEMATRKL